MCVLTGDSQIPPSLSFGAPARSNKIYKSDEVFLIEKNKTSDPSITSIPYKKQKKSADCKSNKSSKQKMPEGNRDKSR